MAKDQMQELARPGSVKRTTAQIQSLNPEPDGSPARGGTAPLPPIQAQDSHVFPGSAPRLLPSPALSKLQSPSRSIRRSPSRSPSLSTPKWRGVERAAGERGTISLSNSLNDSGTY
uniref:Uncharacterized protein n=1 Tax=Haptolina ericina TaxID=156174 RepID=A0A7S3AZN0_9EUKA